MSKNQNMFRSAFDALVEARMAQADRAIAQYRSLNKLDGDVARKR
jgi:hypothetical protein